MPKIRSRHECKDKFCKKRPYFNLIGETRGVFCRDHASDSMVDVGHKRCEHGECTKIPIYNIQGESKGIFCMMHKTTGMVNVLSKRCEQLDCEKIPKFNVPGESKGIYCKDHAFVGMVNVVSNLCEHPDCKKQPNYNIPGETKCLFCADHATEDMVDVKNKKCEHPDCQKIPWYNVPGEKRGIFCAVHKTSEMENVNLKICSSCGLKFQRLVKGLCVSCNPEAKQKALRKEQIVEMFLRKALPQLCFIRDKSTGDIKTCTGQYLRPDFVLTLEDRVIIVECDEHQHWTYAEECEVARMINLSMVYGGLPVFFIRYNPDSFKINDATQTISQGKRQALLKETIEERRVTEPSTILDVKYLFYDDTRKHTFETLLKQSSIHKYM